MISRRSEPEAFKQLMGVVAKLSELVKVDEVLNQAPQAPTQKKTPRTKAPARKTKQTTGYCLRCKADIPLNPESPYCKKCYKSWSRWKNADYAEKHCHSCGKEAETSLSRPQCLPCYRAGR
mgnify:FL=1